MSAETVLTSLIDQMVTFALDREDFFNEIEESPSAANSDEKPSSTDLDSKFTSRSIHTDDLPTFGHQQSKKPQQ